MSLLEKVSHLKVDSSPPVTEGLTLEMVLENRAPSPFSLSEFADYLDQTYCSENLSFYLAVTDYRQSVRLYFGATPDTLDTPVHLQGGGRTFSFRQSESAILNHEEQIRFDKLKAKFQDIIDRFILTNAPQEINIPYELRHQLLKTFREQECYHPALLKPVCVAVTELMRISAFIPFATDPSRLVAATPSKSTTGIKMASSKNNGSNSSPVNGSLRRLRSASSLGLPQTGHAPPVPTATESDSPNTILRKLTNTLRIRARSQSPPRFYGWRHISIPDPSAFLTNTSNSATNTPAAPPMERGFSASSSNSTVSSASSPDSMSSSRYHSNNSATTTTTDNNTATQDTLSAFHPFSDLVEASTRFFSSFGDTKGHSSSFHTSSS